MNSGVNVLRAGLNWFRRFLPQRAPKSFGSQGEQLAAAYLQSSGYRILARGHRQRLGEIDLIAMDGQTIVFVEVKTWHRGDGGDPSEAVTIRKQERITRAALIYLKRRNLLDQPVRFDVVSIVWPQSDVEPQVRHFQAAFEAVGPSGQMFR